jgi:succinate dehydrogenase / fumarate reductase cytochrome b subunit
MLLPAGACARKRGMILQARNLETASMAEIHKGQRAARPEYRNLSLGEILRYRMPPPAIVSILHRISGVLLFLVGIPFILYLFQNSLTSELSFDTYRAAVSSWFGKLVLLALIWAFIHHLLAGIRFLLLDLHIAGEREQSATTARVVLGLSLLITLVCALLLFGLV